MARAERRALSSLPLLCDVDVWNNSRRELYCNLRIEPKYSRSLPRADLSSTNATIQRA